MQEEEKTQDAVRLNKYLAQCGLCSRREADEKIAAGQVTVNGTIASPGLKVTGSETILVDGRPLRNAEEKIVLAYYKPVGQVCTHKDPHETNTVEAAIDYPTRLTYAGRLDKTSEGLLLLTNDGDLIQALMGSEYEHEKEYQVFLNRPPTKEAIRRMEQGVYLEDLGQTTRPCKITRTGDRELTMILTQGLNRQIRRMCRAVGLRGTRLIRVRVANVMLGTLHPGQYRKLSGDELEKLYRACNDVSVRGACRRGSIGN